jgi:hypothetical protein
MISSYVFKNKTEETTKGAYAPPTQVKPSTVAHDEWCAMLPGLSHIET